MKKKLAIGKKNKSMSQDEIHSSSNKNCGGSFGMGKCHFLFDFQRELINPNEIERLKKLLGNR